MDRPPCWPDGAPTPNPCAGALYARLVNNTFDLHGLWTGWRFRGRVLVSPDGERISPERLRGILFREACEKRLTRSRAAFSRGRDTAHGAIVGRL
jgi:hypothetical protein